MSDSREAFEKYFSAEQSPLPLASTTAKVGWVFWQEAQRQALERAAQECEENPFANHAAIIRDLMQPAHTGQEKSDGN